MYRRCLVHGADHHSVSQSAVGDGDLTGVGTLHGMDMAMDGTIHIATGDITHIGTGATGTHGTIQDTTTAVDITHTGTEVIGAEATGVAVQATTEMAIPTGRTLPHQLADTTEATQHLTGAQALRVELATTMAEAVGSTNVL